MVCDECGAAIEGGAGACSALMSDLTARTPDPRLLVVRRTFVDAYTLQHPRTRCAWPQDVAGHLLSLCCAIEYDASLDIYSGMKTWLRRARDLAELAAPDDRGSMTILDAAAADDLEGYIEVVRTWGICVWEAWFPHHETVRGWIGEIRTGV